MPENHTILNNNEKINIIKDIDYIYENKMGKDIASLPKSTTFTHAESNITRRDNWYFGEGTCEVCGFNPATVNLDLKCGSHRECLSCWND